MPRPPGERPRVQARDARRRDDGAVHHTVVSGATEIAHHVLTYVHPTVRIDVRRT